MNDTPRGRVPLTDSAGVGDPEVVTVNQANPLTGNDVPAVLVIVGATGGAGATVSWKV